MKVKHKITLTKLRQHKSFRLMVFILILDFVTGQNFYGQELYIREGTPFSTPVREVNSDIASQSELETVPKEENFWDGGPLSGATIDQGEILEAASESNLTFEAESMQVSEGTGTWNGGTYMLMWGDSTGIHQSMQLAEGGVYDIEIFALGEDVNLDWPAMGAEVDGRLVSDPVEVTRNNYVFKSYLFQGVELEAGSHNLGVKLVDWISGQTLSIDKIVLTKTGELPFPNSRFQLQAESMEAFGGTWNGGWYVVMWGDGEVRQSYQLPESGIYDVEVVALSNEVSGRAFPSMFVQVDQKTVGDSVAVENHSWNYKGFHFRNLELAAGSHEFKVKIANTLDEQFIAIDRILIKKVAPFTLTPTTGLTSANLTNFSGSPWLVLDPASSASTNLVQKSSSQFQMNYNVTAAGSQSKAFVSFDNPTTAAVEIRDLSSLAEFIIGASGPAGSSLRFEVEDSLGAKSEVTLINLKSSMQYYKISKLHFTGIDWTKVKRFGYSMDSTLTSTLQGALTLQTKTLLNSNTALTNFSGLPYLKLFPMSNAATSLVQTSNSQFSINYDVSSGATAGASIVLDNPDTGTVEVGNLSSATSFTFGLSGPSSGKIKLEFEDTLGAKSSAILSGLTSSNQYFTVSKNLFTGLDWTKIKQINFSVDSTLVGPLTGTVTVRAKTLYYKTQSATAFPGSPAPLVLEGSSAPTYLTATSTSQMRMNFDLTAAGSFAGTQFSFDDLNTSTAETQNLSQGSTFTVGIQGGNSNIKKVRLEVEDITGTKVSYLIQGLTTGNQYYTLQKSLFPGIDWTKVKSFNFVLDQSMITSSSAYVKWIQFTLNGFLYTRTVTPCTSCTTVTTLPGGPTLSLLPGSSNGTAISSVTDQINLSFDLNQAQSFSGARLSYDNLSTIPIETGSLPSTLVFGLKGPANTVRVELTDVSGKKASVILTGITITEKFFSIATSWFTGVDKTKIKWIDFILNPVVGNNAPKTGTLEILAKGFLDASVPVEKKIYLISAPYTDSAQYSLQYHLGDVKKTESAALTSGENLFNRSMTASDGSTVTEIFKIYLVPTLRQSESLDYDENGNLTSRTDSQGTIVSYSYDSLNQLTLVTGIQSQPTGFKYDKNGNLTEMTDSRGVTSYTYDNLNRLTQVTFPDAKTLSYAYNLSGDFTQLTYPDGTSVSYSYDANSRLKQVTRGTEITTYNYNAAGDLTEQILPNGVKTAYTYDLDGRLDSITHSKADGTLIQKFVYTLDANGNRTQVVETLPGNVTKTTQYTYDSLNRLQQVIYPDAKIVTYTYDAGGNRKTMLEQVNTSDSGVLTTYFYGIENRLERFTRAQAAAPLIITTEEFFYYDPRGNLVSRVYPDKTVLYTYDMQNLLTKVDDGKTVTEFIYDGQGNRVAKLVNGLRTDYIVETSGELSQVLQEFDDTGVIAKSYAYGLNRVSVTSHQAPVTSYFLQDGLGSTTALTNSSGSVAQSYSYDAFGNLLPPSTVSLQPFAYTGEQFDPETGLIYLRARYYDPILGRFLSKDPVLGKLNETQSFNSYIYVKNNAANFIDPTGQVAAPLIVIGALGGAAVGWYKAASSELYSSGSTYASINAAGFRGALSGAAGALAGGIAFTYGANPWLSGAFSGAISNYLDQRLKGSSSVIDYLNSVFSSSLGGRITSGFIPIKAPGWLNIWSVKELSQTVGKDSIRFGTRSLIRPILSPILKSGLESLESFFGSRGGVLINLAASLVGENLSQITGATYDPVSGQFILLGTNNAAVPDIRMDDLITALETVYSNFTEHPGVTIDPVLDSNGNADWSQDQDVIFFGGLENTDLGWVVFEADRLMKSLAAGKDNITQLPLASSVPGYQNMLELCKQHGTCPGITNRYWFVPEVMQLTRTSDGKSFQFSQVKIKVMVESTKKENGQVVIVSNPAADAFGKHLSDYYDLYAKEFPIFERLRQVMKAVALARFMRDNNIPVDFSWLEDFAAPSVSTPTTTPTVTNTLTYNEGNSVITLTHEGGVKISGSNAYLSDTGSVSTLVSLAKSTRSDLLTQNWQVDSSLNAVALSLMPQQMAGNFATVYQDISVPTPGDLVLSLNRFYDSFEGQKSPLGFNWRIDPYAAKFEKPGLINLDELNGFREGRVRVFDRSTGRELIFQSSLVITVTSNGDIFFNGLNLSGRPNFIASGDTDGSTFVMNADKTYTFRRLDGSTVLFNSNGKILKETDRFGKTLTYTYSSGRITKITDSLSRSITLTYNSSGRITRADGPLGLSVTYTYNAAGDLASVKDVRTGLITTYTYDANHNLIGSVDGFGFTSFGNQFNILGIASSQTDERGNTYGRSYDQITRKETISNSTLGNMIREYDSQQRVIKETDYLGQITLYTYSGNNRLPASVTDPKGHKVNFTYDPTGRLLKVIDNDNLNSFGATLEFTYDPKGNVDWMRDTRGVVRTFVYDPVTSDLKEIRETLSSTQTKVTKFTYDAAGNLTSITDADNRSQNYTYDPLGNLMTEKDGFGIEVERRTYDELFRLTSISDALNRSTSFDYNSLDQMTSISTVFGTVNFTYDSKGNLSVVEDARLNQTTFTYDPTTGDFLQVIDPDGKIAQYEYDDFGRLTRINDPNGQVTVFEYDALGRMTYFGAERVPSSQITSTQQLSAFSTSETEGEIESQRVVVAAEDFEEYFYTPLIWDALASQYETQVNESSTKKRKVKKRAHL